MDDYQKLIAQMAAQIFSANGWTSQEAVEIAQDIAKLCGIEESLRCDECKHVKEAGCNLNHDHVCPSLTQKMESVGMSQKTIGSPMIDTDKDPCCPDWLKVESHKKGGFVDPKNIGLYLTDKQKSERVKGVDLQKELANQPVLNACVLDYLLEHTDEIPEDWKGKNEYFWGTIYRGSDGNLCVRYLCWCGGRWHWSSVWLGCEFDAQNPAAVMRK